MTNTFDLLNQAEIATLYKNTVKNKILSTIDEIKELERQIHEKNTELEKLSAEESKQDSIIEQCIESLVENGLASDRASIESLIAQRVKLLQKISITIPEIKTTQEKVKRGPKKQRVKPDDISTEQAIESSTHTTTDDDQSDK